MKISFDFDNTLWDPDKRDFIIDTIILLREFVAKGDDVCILTSRGKNYIPDVQSKLNDLGLGHLQIFSAPGGGLLPSKADIIELHGITWHYDDMPDHEDLAAVKRRVKEPPATTAASYGMY